MSVGILVAVIFAVVLTVLGTVFTVMAVRDRRRRQRREEHGVRAQAIVTAVEPAIPEQRGGKEQPFVLRYAAAGGVPHEQRFTSGFNGIVPAEGWQLELLFDPQDPANVEITSNPYLHAVDGAAPTTYPARRWLIAAVITVTVALAVWGIALLISTIVGRVPDDPAYTSGMLASIGLIFYATAVAVAGSGVAMLVTATRERRAAATATGVITQTWTEIRRSNSGDDGPSSTRVHPYAVRFALPDGRQVHRRAHDTPQFDRNRPGQQVEVAYQPAAPTSFAVGGPGRRLLAPILTMLFGLLFAGVATVLAVIGGAV